MSPKHNIPNLTKAKLTSYANGLMINKSSITKKTKYPVDED